MGTIQETRQEASVTLQAREDGVWTKEVASSSAGKNCSYSRCIFKGEKNRGHDELNMVLKRKKETRDDFRASA